MYIYWPPWLLNLASFSDAASNHRSRQRPSSSREDLAKYASQCGYNLTVRL